MLLKNGLLFCNKHIILLERKYIREDASVDGYVKNGIWHTLYNFTTYACVLSDIFSLQEDII